MKRNLFIKNSGLSLFGLVAIPFNNILANQNLKSKKLLNLGTLANKGYLVKIAGQFFDSETKESVSARLKIHKIVDGVIIEDSFERSESFVLQNDLGNGFSEKINFVVEAKGFKTFEGYLLVNKVGVYINTDFWAYNPKFKADLKPNKHINENGTLKANFDFHLVKL